MNIEKRDKIIKEAVENLKPLFKKYGKKNTMYCLEFFLWDNGFCNW
jgi:hypothetical protein